MAATPEAKVKAEIKAFLKSLTDCFFFSPIGGPFAQHGIPDIIVSLKGRFVAIEAKAPTKEPSERQVGTIERMRVGGAQVFVIDGLEGIGQLASWLIGVQALNYD